MTGICRAATKHSFLVKGARVSDPQKLDAAIAKAVRAKGPVLVEVKSKSEE